MSNCNGICVWAWELIPGGSGIAYPHPDCEEHGDPAPDEPTDYWMRMGE